MMISLGSGTNSGGRGKSQTESWSIWGVTANDGRPFPRQFHCDLALSRDCVFEFKIIRLK